jgi:aryl-alcohol dehydrogenase-like predicted oxidoreductase
MDDTRIDIIQLPFNVLDNHNIKGDLLLQAKLKGKEIHTRSVFLQGLFFKTIENLDPKFENLKTPLIHLNNIALKADISIESLALNYCLHKSYIDQVLIGVDNFSQLNQNLSLINADLTIENEIDSNIFVDNVAMLNPVNWS